MKLNQSRTEYQINWNCRRLLSFYNRDLNCTSSFCCIWANKVLHSSFNAVLHLRFGSHTQNTSFNIIHILRGSFIMSHLLWRGGWKWNSKCGEIPGLFALQQLFQNNWGLGILQWKQLYAHLLFPEKFPIITFHCMSLSYKMSREISMVRTSSCFDMALIGISLIISTELSTDTF